MNPLFKNKLFLHQKYVVEGLSAKQISKEIFSSKTAVLEALERFGIAVREQHLPHGNPSQPRFGKRLKQHQMIDDRVEQKVIQVVRELRNQGFSLRKIAQILTDMRVATKCHAKAWHPEMVRRIIDYLNTTDT